MSSKPLGPLLAVVYLSLAACAPPPTPTPTPASAPAAKVAAAAVTSDVRQVVRALTSRSADDLERSSGGSPGAQVIRIRGGFNEVLVARINSDGSTSTRCVDTAEGAEAFLGDDTPSAPAVLRVDR
jgi:hypothetical protein